MAITAGHRGGAVGRSLVAVTAMLVAVVSIVFARGSAISPTTYASSSPLAGIAAVTAGLSLLATGAWFTLRQPRRWTGTLTMLTGSVWMAGAWTGWWRAPAILISSAMVITPFLLPLIFNLAIAFPSSSRVTARRLVLVAYLVTAVVSLGQASLRDPLYDRYCWENCTTNVFLIHADLEIMRWLRLVVLWSTIILGVLATVVILDRLWHDTPVARHVEVVVLVPAALAILAESAHAIALLASPAEDPRRPVFAAIYMARAASLVAIAGGLAVTLAISDRTRAALAQLARRLGDAAQPGALQTTLAAALGDRDLKVAYWLPDGQHYVEAEGRTIEPVVTANQAATALVRNGEPIALVVHDRALRDSHQLATQIGAATRLAVDNERLRAERLAHIRDLRASRARIIDAADTSRRMLERDLHDGAQHRLLAVAHELRLAAETSSDPATTTLLGSAIDQAQQALAELRDIAHGIFPAILADAGLGPALCTLADRAPVAVEVMNLADRRDAPAVETAAYSLIAAALEQATDRAATYMTIRIVDERQRLVIDLIDDGTPSIGISSIDAVDRIGALDGHITYVDGRLRVEIPCASS